MTTRTTAPSEGVPGGNPLDDRFDLLDGEVHLSGIQALVRLPMDQRRLDERRGLDVGIFISGYEGSPLAGLDLQLSRQAERLGAHRVVFRPGVNEELAANAVQGSQLASASPDRIGDGVTGIWYGKAPGLDRATDAIRHSNLAGTHRRGGVLALVGDDSIAKSSTVPSSSEPAIAELGMPCLSPADPQDILDLGLHGIAMSRASGLWVAMKLATNVVDGSGTVSLSSARVMPVAPDNTFGGEPFVHEPTGNLLQPTLGKLEATQVRQRMELARRYAAANDVNRIIGDPAATLGIVCAGATYLDVRQALSDMGITSASISGSGVRVLKLGMVHPLEPGIVARFSEGLSEIVVVEEKKAFIELALKDLLYARPGVPQVHGKRDEAGEELFRADGDLPADYIAARLAPRIRRHGGAASVTAWLDRQRSARRVPTLLPILPRPPAFCSGCPHNSSTKVPAGSLVGAGIGCHAMVAFMPEDRVGPSIGHSQMGGEGAAWAGMAPFVTQDHLFQNLGDGTFHHSGSLAIRAAIAGGSHITYKLLYNDAVAMTGGQQAVGKMTVPEIVAELLAEGVARVVITSDQPKHSRRAFGRRLPAKVTVRHRDDMIPVQEELARTPGVTVLIHEQECATELRRKRKRGLVEAPTRRILINERVCEGCGDCGDKSGCLSVRPTETEFGRKTAIHQASCNLDFSCLKGDCPSFVEVVPRKGTKKATREQVPATTLPTPRMLVTPDDFSMRIMGVGGTGVVTVAQVLAAAASHAGLKVKGLDQLGLAQKGGAVVSDVRLSTSEIVGTNKIGPGACDLYLGCDILVAATESNLAVMGADRTYAVVSTSVTPTGQMVTDTKTSFPRPDDLITRIEWAGSRPENVFVDAHAATGAAALDEDQYDNVFLLGVAVQAGVLPLSPEDIEWALDVNGVQVERNIKAFRLGRQHAVSQDPADASTTARAKDHRTEKVASTVQVPGDTALGILVRRRVDELIAYQNVAWAQRYAHEVENIRKSEASALDDSTAITETYARHLYKVMAYKDEYEVARLHISPALERQVHDEFGEGARYSILLHPPILRAMGLKNKIRLRSWWGKPVLRSLYAMRALRGTRFDIFGYDAVRREERRLIDDYARSMATAVAALSVTTRDLVLELAGLPDVVRGYEDIKLRTVKEYQERRTAILDHLAG
ncbi:indolepyruvate ferredoxin oxidoreductase family protein [Amycolatopsis pithecellobii]|uniref:Indolepyruvate ferredoxin oxidoreductase family protein n=1 Tax=Amycolatopsis pithecellobii TaxID=664692 RepID=A0A6N7Z3T6_9PSEU|nr:indolepyruvate ferredoxin oxidoreductase family protein [Amycolatopsis pithecellobii]MTD54961.1 indolepyruvate ferredoxin oxidoreductase family protein [Amycolatopsis pithecellobii]